MDNATHANRILIVDDDPSTCRTLQLILQKKGYSSTIAQDGREALKAVKTEEYDIAIVDLQLPETTGTELVKKIIQFNPDLSFLFLTGHASMDSSIEALNIGASAYFTKPVNFNSLLHKIRQILHEREQRLQSDKEKHLLTEERDRIREYLDAAGVIMVLLDKNGNIEYLNKFGRSLIGYEENEIIGKNWFDEIIPSEEQEAVKAVHKANMKGTAEVHEKYENTIVLRDGSKRIVSWVNSIIEGEDGNIVGVLSSGTDMTEERRMLKELAQSKHDLKERIKELSTLYELTQLISNQELSVEEIIEQLVRMLPGTFQFTEITTARITYGSDIWTSEAFSESNRKIKASFEGSNEKTGTIEVFYLDESKSFLNEEVDLLDAIRQHLLLAIRQRASRLALAESESLFRNVFDDSPVAIVLCDDQGNFVRANDAFYDLFESSRDAQFSSINLLRDPELPEDITRKIRSGQTAYFDTEFDFDRLGKKIDTTRKGIAFIQGGISPIHYGEQGELMGYVIQLVDTTERTKMRQKYKKERDRAQLYLDLAGVMFLALDENADITLLNKKGCDILGCSQDEIIGSNWIEEFIPPEEQKDTWKVFREILEGDSDKYDTGEVHILTRFGNKRLIKWHNAPLIDETGEVVGVLGSGEDVTERRRARAALRKSQRRFSLFANKLPGQMFIKDKDLRFLYVNQHMIERFGADDWVGKKPEQCYPVEIAKEVRHSDQQVLENRDIEVEEELTDLNNSTHIYKVLKFPIIQEDGDTLIAGLGVDISKLRDVQQKLQSERDRAFFYLDLMGHDIRNKLQAIIMSMEVLESEALESSSKSILDTAMTAAEKCGKLIDDVKETEDLAESPIEVLNWSRLVQKTVKSFRELHPDVQIDLSILNNDAPVKANRFLATVHRTLLENAIEHNSSRTKRIWIQLDKIDSHFRLSIADNGNGISDERMATMFDMERRYGGVGLLQAKQIIERFGGRISVRDRVPQKKDKGALFEVLLPGPKSNAIENHSITPLMTRYDPRD